MVGSRAFCASGICTNHQIIPVHDGIFMYNSNFKMDGIILDNDIAIFKDKIDKYVKTLFNNLMKTFKNYL
jgi:hypothetical protein